VIRFARRARERDQEQGQMIVLFALIMVALISFAGLLVDGGMLFAARRQAQNAADTAALAAAKAIATGASASTAASTIAGANGFPAATTNCAGQAISGVSVNNPPTSGSHAGDTSYVEIVTQKAQKTAFAGLVGQPCWMVSARAVAVADRSAVAPCNFCSLNDTSQNHTLVLKNSATLRVDGDIYVDSTNGGYTPGTCMLKQWNVCGDGFDVFGTGGSISAKTISVVGGWETHDLNIATADSLATVNGNACPEHPNPPSQTQTANVCIHMPTLIDPLNDSSKPGNIVQPPSPGSRPVAGQNGCPSTAVSGTGTSGSPSLLTLASGTPTICPGTYYGGIKVTNSARVTMLAGTYVIVGGGFQVLNSSGVDGSAGVMIYNASGAGTALSTTPGTDHVPAAVPGHLNVKAPSLNSSNQPLAPGGTTTYTMSVQKNGAGGLPTGVVDFYDSNTVICASVALVPKGDGKTMQATCSQSYALWGSHAISAVYTGDTVYNGAGDTFTQTVTTPSGTNIGPVTLQSTGPILLTGPQSGTYGGLTIFQERTSNLTITIDPGTTSANSAIPDCPGTFMTADLSGFSGWKGGCGNIGGLRGTIYAPHDDALVLINAGGLAFLQVMAGQIEIDSGANARFGYNAPFFANGQIHLVE
jgi:Flp pilus assembly protein TadG